MAIDLGVGVVVQDAGRVLLIKREDFEVWALPAGGVESGETLAQTAIREVREETGLVVELTRLVGIYSQPSRNSHSVVFGARPVGGELRPQPGEVVDLGFFDPDDLPLPTVWWIRQRVRDALAGAGSSPAWLQDVIWKGPSGLDRPAIYRLRDRSGLTRSDFFEQYFGQTGPLGEKREV